MGTKRYTSGEVFTEFAGVPPDLPLDLTHDWLRDAGDDAAADLVKVELERLGRHHLFTSVKPEFCRQFCGTCPGCKAAMVKIADEDRAFGDAMDHDRKMGRRSGGGCWPRRDTRLDCHGRP